MQIEAYHYLTKKQKTSDLLKEFLDKANNNDELVRDSLVKAFYQASDASFDFSRYLLVLLIRLSIYNANG